jgi:hypothetical protein
VAEAARSLMGKLSVEGVVLALPAAARGVEVRELD